MQTSNVYKQVELFEPNQIIIYFWIITNLLNTREIYFVIILEMKRFCFVGKWSWVVEYGTENTWGLGQDYLTNLKEQYKRERINAKRGAGRLAAMLQDGSANAGGPIPPPYFSQTQNDGSFFRLHITYYSIISLLILLFTFCLCSI